MVDAFFLEVPQGSPAKCLNRGSRQGKNWKKSSIFHRTVEMKQPHTLTEPFLMKCVGKGAEGFPLPFP